MQAFLDFLEGLNRLSILRYTFPFPFTFARLFFSCYRNTKWATQGEKRKTTRSYVRAMHLQVVGIRRKD